MFETTKESWKPRTLARTSTFVLLAIPILIAGYLAQASTYLNHDVAWVLYSSGLMLQGAQFGEDIVAANPPLIWWVSMVPNAIARFLELPVIETFRLFVLLLIGISLFICDRLLVAARASLSKRAAFLLTGCYVLTVAIHRDYGQREHLAVLLVLPYILAVAHRASKRPIGSIGAFALGAAAGVGVAFKPYFMLVPLLLEAALLWRTRSLGSLLRPEALGAIFAVALYAIALLLFARPWMFGALPDIARVYWAFEQPLFGALVPLAVKFLLPVIAACLVLRVAPSSEGVALVLAAVGFFGAALLQGKYYTYHIYPAFALLVLAFVIDVPRVPKPWRLLVTGMAVLVLALDLRSSATSLVHRSHSGQLGKRIASVVAFVAEYTPPDGSFLAISTHPYPGFPTALYADRRWASASNSRLFLPAVVRLRESGAAADPELLRFAEAEARESMMRDLAYAPDVVLIDRHGSHHAIGGTDFDFLDFYMEDPEFRTAWGAYERWGPAPDGFDAYVRRRGRS